MSGVYLMEAMYAFLSPESIAAHRTYMQQIISREEALRHGQMYDDRSPEQLYRDRRRDGELYNLCAEALAHKLYFSSFVPYATVSDALGRRFGGLTTLFGELWTAAHAAERFLFIGTDRRGELLVHGELGRFLARRCRPTLALDLCEHAYFSDYGFNRDAYVRAALGHLDLGRLLSEASEEKEENLTKTD